MSTPAARCARIALIILSVSVTPALAADQAKPLVFEVTYKADFHPGPISARVYVMLSKQQSGEPRMGPNWFRPEPFFAVEAKDWKPGEPLRIGADSVGFPGPLDKLEPGTYSAQAVVRLNPDTHSLGSGEGNGYGPVVRMALDPAATGAVALTIDKIVPPRKFPESDRVKLVDIPSPILSKFYGRPVRQRAGVILPEGDPARKRPTLYIIPGFGGDHFMAAGFAGRSRFGYGKDMIRVVLDPDCGTGHHVFADSATNGPRGRALVEEMIPYIEKTFPAIAEPGARLLNGHSSGGWSSLWLQVTYPDTFGGTWSTSPDPVDFRDFQRIDLYAANQNMFRDAEGKTRPLARRGTQAVLFYEPFSNMEDVIGDGGQLRSFEAVFSPLGPDGKALKLWDRRTGAVDPKVARAWESYDIRLVLERNWKNLGPKLAGKLHVITGDLDTFYLEGAVKLLKESLEKLGSDAVVEVVPGKDHSNLLDSALSERLAREMSAAIARYAPKEPAAVGAGAKGGN